MSTAIQTTPVPPTVKFRRWRDFALRMARTCYATSRRPNVDWLTGVIDDWFSEFDPETIESIVNWDHSDGDGLCVSDMMTYFLAQYRGWPPLCRACSGWKHRDEECRCEEVEESFYDQWNKQWGDPVECCVRAGLDCAFEQSMGVIGFTAGDLRRMYPEGVPVWITGTDPWDVIGVKAVVPGVGCVPSEPKPNGTFDEIADDVAIWI